ncbi:MAG: 30S ribosomal protein S5 [Candidatus Woesearchaeota archaeon]
MADEKETKEEAEKAPKEAPKEAPEKAQEEVQEAPESDNSQEADAKTPADIEKEIQEGEIETEKTEEAVKPIPEDEVPKKDTSKEVEGWQPKTKVGKQVLDGEITSIGEALDSGRKIREVEIVDALMPDLESDLLLIGQSKGKFGGGQRRVFKQTQKKTQEGNKPKFATFAVSGNKDGIVGLGYGKAKETVPAREKAFKQSKLNLIKVRRGCGEWRCGCNNPHSIPFAVEGKCGSAVMRLMPAPKGKGLCVEKECQKILSLAGIKDIWSKTRGQTGTKVNLIIACYRALQKLMEVKVLPGTAEKLGMREGETKKYGMPEGGEEAAQ